MLDIFVCEDNDAVRQKVTQLISNYCLFAELDAQLVLSTESPTVMLETFKHSVNPVLFFLDIDLGVEIDGMELARQIRALNKETFIVFFTTKSEMLPVTFRYQLEALDFIVKDATDEEINERIRSAIDTALLRHIKTGNKKTFQVKSDEKTIILPMEEIIFIETTGVRHRLTIHTQNRRLTINGDLKKIEADLDDRFMRCHQSYLVNRDHIEAINLSGNMLIMMGGMEVPLSRTGKKLLKASQ